MVVADINGEVKVSLYWGRLFPTLVLLCLYKKEAVNRQTQLWGNASDDKDKNWTEKDTRDCRQTTKS